MKEIEVVKPLDLTEAQSQVWRELTQQQPHTQHPFLQPEYILTAGHYLPETRVALVRDNGVIRAVFPFSQQRAGHGTAVFPELSDYHGLIGGNDGFMSGSDLLEKSGLNIWHFDHLPLEDTTFSRHASCLEPAWIIELSEGLRGYEDHLRQRKSQLAAQVRRKSNKLARECGPLKFEVHEPTEERLQELVTWKKNSLMASQPKNVFCWPWIADFLRDLTKQKSPEFEPELSTLCFGETCVAVHFGLRTRDRLVSWIPAYHPEFSSFSPGLILHWEMIRSAAERGIHVIELGRGSNQLKLALSTGSRQLALGAAGGNYASRVLRAGWYWARHFVHTRCGSSSRSVRLIRRIKQLTFL